MALQRKCFSLSPRSPAPCTVALPTNPFHQSPRRQPHSHLHASKSLTSISAPPAPGILDLRSLQSHAENSRPSAAPVATANARTALPPIRCLTIVTGASRGLGAAIARVLALNGPPCAAAGWGASTGNTPPSNPATAAASGWIHDLVLLATDSQRLQRFVRGELAPCLEQQQQGCRLPQGKQVVFGTAADTHNSPIAASPSAGSAASEEENLRPGEHPSAAGVTATATTAAGAAAPAEGTRAQEEAGAAAQVTRTRVRGLCFDLGDLDSLEANTSRLLAPAPRADADVHRGACVDMECAWPDSTSEAVATPDGRFGGDGSGSRAGAAPPGDATDAAGVDGVLPLPSAAYTHVLLVHNAGQVGDLLPLELQSLANMRRQTDLNVTSFAHLTAAVLRTFVHTPLVADGSEAWAAEAGLATRQQQQQLQDVQGEEQEEEEQEEKEQAKAGQQPRVQVASIGDFAAAGGSGHARDSSGAGGVGGSSVTSSSIGVGPAGLESSAGNQLERCCREQQQRPQPQPAPPQPPQQVPPSRRVVTIVNISSVSVDQPYEHFSLYGMGKAARHMIVRSVAHEAALREAELEEEARARAGVEGEAEVQPGARARRGTENAAEAQNCMSTGGAPSLPARVRACSYAPGAIDTEMQAAAREALPRGPLKSRFEENAASGRLVDPRVSARVLYDILARDAFANGAHMDYYSEVAAAAAAGVGGEAPTSAHPLARSS